MKLLHTADWHVGKTLRNRSRADEHRAVLDEIAQIARDEKVDLILVAGDLFDSAAPTPESEEIVYAAFLDLASTGAEVIVVAGNHDHPQRLLAVAPLLERAKVRTSVTVRRPSEGGVLSLTTKGAEKVQVALLPFISQRRIVGAAQLMAGEAWENRAEYEQNCRQIIDQLCRDLDPKAIQILIGHLTIVGGKVGGGERQAHTVFDYWIPPQAFPASLHYVALGHLHAPQRISGSPPIWYSGAPIQLDFGEGEIDNRVLIVEARAGTPAEPKQVPLRSGKKLRTLKGSLAELRPLAQSVGDAYLRLVLHEPTRIGLAEEARELFPNAVDVRIEGEALVAPNPAAHEEASPSDLFRAYLAEQKVDDEGLMSAFGELLEKSYAS